ncbi:AAA family ATPase [Bacillaceae bacterium SIJ1]|uniref:AAA family ATPase n=1 Tax=Litoribacterium kuwaitense TaxID=1398745 RepID=UPI0013EBF686|nr:AAA family ATPase [Litoribacterium kuwaitense]NGP44456.1 AAA family ATPase [Litoribacterium kuwaitense]
MEVKRSLTLAIADTDQEYLQSLAQFFRSSEDDQRYDVKMFSTTESLDEFLRSRTKTDLVLSSQEMTLDEELLEKHIRYHAVLSDQPEEGAVFKYQPLPQMLRKLTNHYYALNRPIAGSMASNETTQVLTVTSASGGAGKTTLSVLLAATMASQQYNVLYISLEEYHSTHLFFRSSKDMDSSPLLYYAKAKPDLLEEQYMEYIVQDEATNVHFLNLPAEGSDIQELSDQDAQALISAADKTEAFDFVVIDGDSSLQPRMIGALKKSHYVLQLLTDDLRSYEKTRIYLESLEKYASGAHIEQRIGFILNKFLGDEEEIFSSYGFDIQSRLPYVPDWKTVTDAHQLYHSALYMEQVRELFSLMTTKRSKDTVETV